MNVADAGSLEIEIKPFLYIVGTIPRCVTSGIVGTFCDTASCWVLQSSKKVRLNKALDYRGTVMMNKLKDWWTLDEAAEAESVDNPFAPLTPAQRQDTLPMLTLAFGWGFLITGLLTGGQLGAGVAFWPDLILATLVGNTINFVIGGLVAYIGYKTACNSGLLYQFVYGRIGVFLPVIFLALLTTGWQAIVVGAFGFAWAQDFDSPTFYAVAIFGGLLFTVTTYYGVKGIERVSVPSVAILVLVGLYAIYLNVDQAGGGAAFLAMSRDTAAQNPISFVTAVNLVVGSWIVGAVVMAEYTRFAKKVWVALAIPFIVMIIAQWFLQIVGALGGVVSGSADFTTYLLQQGMVIGGIGLIGMSLALWTTGDANLYLPVIQTSAVFKRPKRVMVVVWGVLGTILGLGLYQYFLAWISLLAALVPPLIGPLVVDYYVVHKRQYDANDLKRLHTWNWAAVLSYAIGAYVAYGVTYGVLDLPDILIPSLLGLVVSMVAYAAIYFVAAAMNKKVGYASVSSRPYEANPNSISRQTPAE
ncbi:MAG: cytosine permease [Rhodospirillales bacterium]